MSTKLNKKCSKIRWAQQSLDCWN